MDIPGPNRPTWMCETNDLDSSNIIKILKNLGSELETEVRFELLHSDTETIEDFNMLLIVVR
jgi:hypothetical protein